MATLFDEPPDETAPDTLVDALRLTMVSGVGPRTRKALLERFGSARAALAAGPTELCEVEGVGPKLCAKIVAAGRDRRRSAKSPLPPTTASTS